MRGGIAGKKGRDRKGWRVGDGVNRRGEKRGGRRARAAGRPAVNRAARGASGRADGGGMGSEKGTDRRASSPAMIGKQWKDEVVSGGGGGGEGTQHGGRGGGRREPDIRKRGAGGAGLFDGGFAGANERSRPANWFLSCCEGKERFRRICTVANQCPGICPAHTPHGPRARFKVNPPLFSKSPPGGS